MKKYLEMHDKGNADYISAKAKLFEEGQGDKLSSLANDRLGKLDELLDSIKIPAKANYVEVIDLYVSFFDDVIVECVELAGRRAEFEEKIISRCAGYLPEKNDRDEENEHVTAKIIDCTKSSDPPDKIAKIFADAILHDTNPLRLGSYAFVEFCKQHPTVAPRDVHEYLLNEVEVRTHLITGDDVAAFASIEKLLKSSINCAEKFLLVSLSLFYLGYEDDARNALDVGLRLSPNNERLLSAKGALE
ncbi:MAG: hypothetical protein FWF80_03245 [Defluviitaleaceae bacterium]|nr:hypothetical protein [Defluviitaleaceae bacterium]